MTYSQLVSQTYGVHFGTTHKQEIKNIPIISQLKDGKESATHQSKATRALYKLIGKQPHYFSFKYSIWRKSAISETHLLHNSIFREL